MTIPDESSEKNEEKKSLAATMGFSPLDMIDVKDNSIVTTFPETANSHQPLFSG